MTTPIRPKSGHRPIIGVSTKMYFTHAQTKAFTAEVLSLLSSLHGHNPLDHLDAFFLPDFLATPSIIDLVASWKGSASPSSQCPSPPGQSLLVGAQDCSHHDFGAHTGDVSPAVLRELGARLIAVGHAERRGVCPPAHAQGEAKQQQHRRGETDAEVRDKACAVAENGMWPLLCVGEVDPPGEGEDGVEQAAREVTRQVEAALERDCSAEMDEVDVVIAYEPVWAIGAPEPASPEHVIGMVRRLREGVRRRRGRARIMYGAAGLGLWERLGGEVDGLFLGRFAHQPENFVRIMCEVTGISGPREARVKDEESSETS
ncbi:hypothetical protein VTJ49DRAFT_236 [Mycothermus thermophilus]|uniref:Triosephosphate isomerase n=1 Tax=Humicola insolens TaxID=85995 RepID=A0ABR3VGX1_HUMIN